MATLALLFGCCWQGSVATGAPVYRCDKGAGQTPCPNAPGQTPAEKAAAAEARRRAAIAEEGIRDAQRADDQLLGKYPSELAHRAAEVAALQAVASNIRSTRARFEATARECRPHYDEAAFYPDGKLPPRLQAAVDACNALFDVQKDMFRNLEADLALVVERFRVQRAHLRTLWSAASPP